jgi:hypothetical protein
MSIRINSWVIYLVGIVVAIVLAIESNLKEIPRNEAQVHG